MQTIVPAAGFEDPFGAIYPVVHFALDVVAKQRQSMVESLFSLIPSAVERFDFSKTSHSALLRKIFSDLQLVGNFYADCKTARGELELGKATPILLGVGYGIHILQIRVGSLTFYEAATQIGAKSLVSPSSKLDEFVVREYKIVSKLASEAALASTSVSVHEYMTKLASEAAVASASASVSKSDRKEQATAADASSDTGKYSLSASSSSSEPVTSLSSSSSEPLLKASSSSSSVTLTKYDCDINTPVVAPTASGSSTSVASSATEPLPKASSQPTASSCPGIAPVREVPWSTIVLGTAADGSVFVQKTYPTTGQVAAKENAAAVEMARKLAELDTLTKALASWLGEVRADKALAATFENMGSEQADLENLRSEAHYYDALCKAAAKNLLPTAIQDLRKKAELALKEKEKAMESSAAMYRYAREVKVFAAKMAAAASLFQ